MSVKQGFNHDIVPGTYILRGHSSHTTDSLSGVLMLDEHLPAAADCFKALLKDYSSAYFRACLLLHDAKKSLFAAFDILIWQCR